MHLFVYFLICHLREQTKSYEILTKQALKYYQIGEQEQNRNNLKIID